MYQRSNYEAHTQTDTHTNTHIHTHTNTQTHTYTHIHTHTNTQTHTYTHTQTHKHTHNYYKHMLKSVQYHSITTVIKLVTLLVNTGAISNMYKCSVTKLNFYLRLTCPRLGKFCQVRWVEALLCIQRLVSCGQYVV